MTYNPDIHHRRSIRLREYDYSSNGAYFVTICAQGRECLFGDILDGEMRLNDAGRMVAEWWVKLPGKFPNVALDEYFVMPNHFQGIICIVGAGFPRPVFANDDVGAGSSRPVFANDDVGAGFPRPLSPENQNLGGETTENLGGRTPENLGGRTPENQGGRTPPLRKPTLGQIVGFFKYQTTKQINFMRDNPGVPVWQRNYFERVIRDEAELAGIREYIHFNPSKWTEDDEYPT
ncbi:transposase [Geotalea uraniireducens]|uniref:Transposase IS200-like domain-containing protein n=1 Tax=Geotalea uraniireducens (strain Rf4) TaxID=351605 RepID=A5G526_GEOUR|nr:transposase [Geotalea uraniireducens]ABQ26894.1 hypothetical protein Gura_2720 [Geotalea uraniireducens Rf4]